MIEFTIDKIINGKNLSSEKALRLLKVSLDKKYKYIDERKGTISIEKDFCGCIYADATINITSKPHQLLLAVKGSAKFFLPYTIGAGIIPIIPAITMLTHLLLFTFFDIDIGPPESTGTKINFLVVAVIYFLFFIKKRRLMLLKIENDIKVVLNKLEFYNLSNTAKHEQDVRHGIKSAKSQKYSLRREPITVSDDDAEKVFGLDDNGRPLEYIANDYKVNKDGTITDHTTGIMWQQSGPGKRLTYKKAKAYIRELNSSKFAGYYNWRLPTVDELKSLLEKEKQSNGLNIDSIFDIEEQGWCWSSDTRSSDSAWSVYFDGGAVSCDYLFNDLDVRAVRSLK